MYEAYYIRWLGYLQGDDMPEKIKRHARGLRLALIEDNQILKAIYHEVRLLACNNYGDWHAETKEETKRNAEDCIYRAIKDTAKEETEQIENTIRRSNEYQKLLKDMIEE